MLVQVSTSLRLLIIIDCDSMTLSNALKRLVLGFVICKSVSSSVNAEKIADSFAKNWTKALTLLAETVHGVFFGFHATIN